MAKKLKLGDSIRGYRVIKVFGPGRMAISYAAFAPSGGKVFLKQYKSPAPSVVWYKPFVNYQRELSSRVRASKVAHFAVRQVDAFEEEWGGRCYFQAYELVENGADLDHILEAERDRHRETRIAPTSDPEIWARHVTWAKVLLMGIAALHEAGIVHADLKPANAYMIEDASIAAGYQLKLIDMDFSLLTDWRAPWHGFQGYVGTDNYRSPEHIARKSIPIPASDVFTCGLMLYELLAGVHPYWSEDQGDYARLVQGYAAQPPKLAGRMPPSASNFDVSLALHRCLSPDPAARPSAAELRAILSGRTATSKDHRSAVSSGKGKAVAGSLGQPITSDKIELSGPNGRSLKISIRTELGKALVRQFGPDGEFWDARQCVVECNASRQWVVSPVAGTTNETLLNGEMVTAPRPLRQGDVIAVGRQSKGVVKLPLAVHGL